MQIKQLLLETFGSRTGWEWGGLWVQRRTWTSESERRHAIEMKAGPLRAAVAFTVVHLWAVAVLVCALWRFVRIIITYLLILLLLFNAAWAKKKTNKQNNKRWGHIIGFNHSWVKYATGIRSGGLQSLWRGLCCTAVTLVSRSIRKGSVHLLLKNVRQGMKWDAAHWGWVVEGVAAVQTTTLKIQ